jgi:DNA-binding PadR family transcriptional regulator
MLLANALLGFLSYGPQTGYDLKKVLDTSTAYFWHAELAQIYPTLKRLVETGLVVYEIEAADNKQDKRIYSITAAGRAAVAEWLMQPLDQLPLKKDSALLQLFFSGTLARDTVLAQLKRQLAVHRAQLTRYETDTQAIVQDNIAHSGLQREGVMWQLVLEYGIGHERHYVEWLEHAIAIVEKELE